ncbi:MAG TPA: DNA mismatch repair protein MutS, partial [Hellea balneolensis]|nr:DNA mismatch repair protein MutS [Hellea balneolensis]
ERQLKTHFGAATLEGFGDFSAPEISAAGAMLDYLELTQAGHPVALSPPRQRASSGFMSIDPATRQSLEIERTQTGSRKGSLLSVIDRTLTGPGARLLAERLNRPLVDVRSIQNRLDAVDYFTNQRERREHIRERLKQSGDAARAYSRIALGRGGPRDVTLIAGTLLQGERINSVFAKAEPEGLPENLTDVLDRLSLAAKPKLAAVVRDIQNAFRQDPPLMARDGGFIATGWAPELDAILQLRDDSRKIIAGLQADYAQQTGVASLKIKHNNVLGYFIEVTPKHGDALLTGPHKDGFIHRQTLVSGIRFTTTELADLDAKISSAADKALALELSIFDGFVERIVKEGHDIRACAAGLAEIDIMCAGAEWAEDAQAVRPRVDDSTRFEIEGGRHPVVETALQKDGAQPFTANDCALDATGKSANRLTLITGPNMAGKSTYLRQNALMFILAQAGYFVPARKAHIGAADALFSRVGASDDLSKGRSTFMTEMVETAAILNRATARTFVILDEIGRGTSTFDGLSIAWASAEHLYEINRCRALFATHYHELTTLIENLDAAGNACLRAKEWEGNLVFLHDVTPGAADKSYGIQVAKLAGLPDAAIVRAKDVLTRLESDADTAEDKLGGLPLFSAPPAQMTSRPSAIDKAIADLDVDDLSPRSALDLLYELKSLSRRLEGKNS